MARPVDKQRVPDTQGMKVVRCANHDCGKFLGYEKIKVGTIQIKCHACKSITEVSAPEQFQAPDKLIQVRCASCGHFLYGQALINGQVRVKCRFCHIWNTLDITPEGVYNQSKVEKPDRAEWEPEVKVNGR